MYSTADVMIIAGLSSLIYWALGFKAGRKYEKRIKKD